MSALVKTAPLFAAALMLAASGAAAQTSASRWLDAKPLANWNKPGAAIPRGPKAVNPEMFRECEKRGAEETKKRPPTSETRQVTAAGWRGVMVDKRAGDTTIVLAFNGLDGMCRPLAYQYFVFVHGRFAGTLSPHPMHAREDGSGSVEEKPGARRFSADFMRYRKDDALCCPARTSTVAYEIRDPPAGGPLVVPVAVATKANQR